MKDTRIFHTINRLTFGSTPGLIQQVKKIGEEAYIQSQLTPASIATPDSLTNQLQSLDTLNLTPGQLYKQQHRLNEEAKQLKLDAKTKQKIRGDFEQKIRSQAEKARLLRAYESPRQLEEVMVDFWYNHFNVNALQGGQIRLYFSAYEQQAIRPHVLGKFRRLLGATAKHPAMLIYLDNWQNTAPGSPQAKGRFKGLNENYARELLELHTLGVDGGYSQADIISLARIFTGWGVPRPSGKRIEDEDGFYFESDRHDFEDKVFLGHQIKGRGIEEGEEALDILARHPSTARYISYKLAREFVVDNPPESLIKKMADKFLETEGEIRLVLKTLFSSSEFWNPDVYQGKFKTPYRYIVSVMRAVGEVSNFNSATGLLRQLGMPLYGCPSPDGYKNTQDAWLNPDTMIRRSSLAVQLSKGLFQDRKPVDSQKLIETLGDNFSENTREVINKSSPDLKAALILGSPDFMKY
ncbi:DUF1800 domain-containing protein [Capilliphycus salinus ALCB114379]|uniref:DUF1800 domain-containing protein n=1 Tax=Capilliphycus salinus TaxID=2768948 RepID=UPI0039A592D7